MTRICDRKTRLRLVTSATVRHRPLIVELHQDGCGITVREHGRRRGYEVIWSSIFALGAAQTADRERAERLARRGGMRRGR